MLTLFCLFFRLKSEFQQRLVNETAYQVARHNERQLSFLKQKLAVCVARHTEMINEFDLLTADIDEKRDAIDKLEQSIKEWAEERTKLEEARKELDANYKHWEQRAKKANENFQTLDAMLKENFETKKRSEKKQQARRVIHHLKSFYSGHVYGRFISLCKPNNRRYIFDNEFIFKLLFYF